VKIMICKRGCFNFIWKRGGFDICLFSGLVFILAGRFGG
jgi:hypothetical protein